MKRMWQNVVKNDELPMFSGNYQYKIVIPKIGNRELMYLKIMHSGSTCSFPPQTLQSFLQLQLVAICCCVIHKPHNHLWLAVFCSSTMNGFHLNNPDIIRKYSKMNFNFSVNFRTYLQIGYLYRSMKWPTHTGHLNQNSASL